MQTANLNNQNTQAMKNLLFLFSALVLTFPLFAQNLQVESEYTGFSNPVDLTNAGDKRLFVVEQGGKIKIIDGQGTTLPTPFLDIGGSISSGFGEQGLLGLAFHPDYSENGFFYVNYTAGGFNLETRISRFSVDSSNPNLADPDSEVILLEFEQPYGNHNGGGIKFGPDGYLYLGVGDGGSGGDPQGFGQNRQSFLGKMLRLDVMTNPDAYTIPADNPFADDDFTLDEIWTLGMRNPWRYSFDRVTGDLWIGDVGQSGREEIHYEAAGGAGGDNYGWNCREGFIPYSSPSADCNGVTDFVDPVFDYDHNNGNGCSVTGGFVYRGCDYPDLYGKYIFGDYCSGRMWTIEPDGADGWTTTQALNSGLSLSSYGEGWKGELYALNHNGQIYKVISDNPFEVSLGAESDSLVAMTNYPVETYQWFNGNVELTDVTGTYFTPKESGNYRLVVTTAAGCEYNSNVVEVIINNTENIKGINDFSYYPSPFKNQLHFNLELENPSNVDISLVDQTGKVLDQIQLTNAVEERGSFNTENLSGGVYFLKIAIGEEVMVRKVLKY